MVVCRSQEFGRLVSGGASSAGGLLSGFLAALQVAPGCSCMATSRARGIASWRSCRVGAFPTGIARAQWNERN